MDAAENHLLSISKVPANSGHSLHKGTPREAFIREYLEGHLSSNVAIGTGEIIDANSLSGQARNQYDIVIYKRSYPKLDFGGGITGFLIESVIATIEVKSVLTQAEFGNARISTPSEAIDGVFVLGKGFLYLDNQPFGFVDDANRQANPSLKWVFADTPNGNLLLLFTLIQQATANIEGRFLNAIPYLSTFSVSGLQWGA